MADRNVSRLLGIVAALLLVAVLWDVVSSHRPAPIRRPVAVVESSTVAAPAPPPTASARGVAVAADSPAAGGSYVDMLARAETRRRIRASIGTTYLNDIVAESQDSALHRWDNRIGDPVRVYLAAGTAANFQPTFLDAVRQAFARWQAAGVPVRFDVSDDSTRAEVRFRWKVQFDIDRTGQTDLVWDQDGRLDSGVVTIATFDPKGRPLNADDVRVVALHEIGHLLGLDHSPDSADVMFPTTTVRDLSSRDIETALLLYQLAPGRLR